MIRRPPRSTRTDTLFPYTTLFRSVGGAISLTTNAPTGDLEGSVKASVGNYDYRRYEGVLNIPLMGDELAVRFAGSYNERDGYGRFVRRSEERSVGTECVSKCRSRW